METGENVDVLLLFSSCCVTKTAGNRNSCAVDVEKIFLCSIFIISMWQLKKLLQFALISQDEVLLNLQ